MIDEAIVELEPLIGVRAARRATDRAQASHYRRHRQSPSPVRPVRERKTQPRALSAVERVRVRALLNSPDFVDKAPATVYHELLDEGVYVTSISSMYRILRWHGQVGERRRQAVHPARVKPELVATAPNRCLSWDITKLHGPAKWWYFHLYVIIDIYRRYTVGWLIADRESAALAEQPLADTVAKQNVDRDTLAIHADNGSSMASKPGPTGVNPIRTLPGPEVGVGSVGHHVMPAENLCKRCRRRRRQGRSREAGRAGDQGPVDGWTPSFRQLPVPDDDNGRPRPERRGKVSLAVVTACQPRSGRMQPAVGPAKSAARGLRRRGGMQLGLAGYGDSQTARSTMG
jgi:transposase InsO family protein